MTTQLVTVDKNDKLERALDLMRKHGVSKLPVTEHRHLVGVLSDGDIVDELGALRNARMSPTGLHVSGAMQRNYATADPDDDVRAVVELCKKEGVGIVPVTRNGDFVGVVTKADLLRLVTSNRPVGDYMPRRLHAVSPDDRVIHARRLMLDHGIERLPVLDGGRVRGIVSELDLAFALDDLKKRHGGNHEAHQLRNLHVRDVMRQTVVVGTERMPSHQAAAVMRERDVGGLPIVEDEDRIVGMITRTDLLRQIDSG
ncbi:MAG TPA: CBS domain-containing protein [Candidatus Thermoplasmatota archaeon]|nr:CBS domain-containing protein [Candidatus Thermoplasmatota archaeon]